MMKYWTVIVVLVIFILGRTDGRGALYAQRQLPDGTPIPDSVELRQDIVYGKGGEEVLYLDMAWPRDASSRLPCVIFIHGGAWRAGTRLAHIKDVVRSAERGYVAATVQYRFCPKYTFPAQVEDVKCAVRFLRAHAEQYNIDPSRIGAVGFSAGAHLAMLLGTMGKEDGLEGEGGWQEESSQVQVVVSFAGPTALDAPDIPDASKPLVRDFLGGTVEEKPELYRRASPVTYVSPGDAVTLLFQGTKDPLVPHTQAYRMIDRLTEAGVAGRAELLVGAGHGWGNPERDRTYEAMFAFLDQHLKRQPQTANSPKGN
jgi:acetyl esterase/lipase